MNKITWSAEGNSGFLNGQREACTVRAAVRAARKYIRTELGGEGSLVIYVDGEAVREDSRTIFTGYRWKVINI